MSKESLIWIGGKKYTKVTFTHVMALKFEITGDNSNLLSSLDGARDGVHRAAEDIERSGLGIEDMFKRIGAAAGIAFSFDAAKSFVSKVVEMRSYFQDIESSMKVFLGSAEKGAEFTQKLKDYAYYNMFEFKDLAAASQQLIAYKNDVDTVIPTLDKLSNIATGTHANLLDLVNLYNKAKNIGSVGSNDLASWAAKGVVVRDVLKEMGINAEGTAVSFEQLNMVLDKVTGEGGMFHNLMGEMMENISAEVGQFEDNLASMLDEIGTKYQDQIVSGIRLGSELVDNYEKIGQILLSVIAMYGEWKASLMLVSAYQSTIAKQETDIEARRIAGLEAVLASTEQTVVAKQEEGAAIDLLIAKKRAEMQANLHNAEISEFAARVELQNAQQRLAAADANVAALEQRNAAAMASGNYDNARAAQAALYNAKLEQQNAQLALNTAETNLGSAAKNKEAMATKLAAFETQVDTVNKQANTTATGIWAAVTNAAAKAWRGLTAAMAANPYGAALIAITAIVSLLPLFSDGLEESADASEKLKKSVDETNAKIASEQANIDNLFDKLRKAKEGTGDYKKVKDQIIDQYGTYLNGLNDEISTLKDVEGAYKAVTKAAREASLARAKEAALKDVYDTYGKDYSHSMESLQEVLNDVAGKDKASEALRELQKELSETGTVSKETEEKVSGLLRGTFAYGESKAWIQGLRNNEKYLNDYKALVEERFAVDENVAEEEQKNEARNKKVIENERKDLVARLENLSKEEAAGNAGKDIKDKIAKLDEELKVYSTKADKSVKKTADKISAEQDKLVEMQKSLEHSRIRAAQDLEERVAEARIAAMEDGAEQVRLQQEKDNRKEIEDINRQREDAIREYIENEKKLFEQEEQVRKSRDSKYKVRKFDASMVDTSTVEAQYDELLKWTKDRQLKDAQKESLEAMRDFLKQYGSFEQQRLATTEEYERKIARATTEGEKLMLQRERDTKLSSLQYENIASGIDWKALFSGVGSLSQEMMQPMVDKLISYTKTEDYLKADSQTQSDVAGLIQELRKYLGTDQSVTWQSLGTATENFVAAVGRYNDAVSKEKSAVALLDKAKSDFKTGKITQEAFDAIKADTEKFGNASQKAREEMEGFATVLNDTSEQVNNFTSKLTVALNNAKGWNKVKGFGDIQQSIEQVDAFKGALDSVLPSLGNGIGKTVANGLSSAIGSGLSSMGSGLSSILSSGLGTTIGFVAQIPSIILELVSSIKNFVTGVLDSFTELVSLRWIDNLVVSITDAIANLIDAILDLPENLFHVLEGIVVNGIGGLLNDVVGRVGNILSFGALDSGGPASWFTNSNSKKVEATINDLTKRNELLQRAIEDLTDEMKSQSPAKAIDSYRKAIDYQKEINKNELLKAQAQANYHDAHHSFNYYWEGFSDDEIKRFSQEIGRAWSGSIWDLSPEEMKLLRGNIDMWDKREQTGKGGYGQRVADMLDEYIALAGKTQEITDNFRTAITGVSFDSLYDSFIGTLTDMTSSAEDFANDFEKMMQKAVINSVMSEKIMPKIQAWYERFAKAMESEGISQEEMLRLLNGYLEESYKKMKFFGKEIEIPNGAKYIDGWNQIVNEALAERDVLMKIFGWSADDEYKQSAGAKGYQTMSQDTADVMNGRLTALQISNENIYNQAVQIYQQMVNMTATNSSSNTYLLEIRNMMVTSNSYLEDVAKYTKKIYQDWSLKIDELNTNIKAI